MPKTNSIPVILLALLVAVSLSACQEGNTTSGDAGNSGAEASASIPEFVPEQANIPEKGKSAVGVAQSMQEPAAEEMTWRPFVDPGMDMEQISALKEVEARDKLAELGVEFDPSRFHESIEMDPVELTALFLQAGMPVDSPNHAGVSPLQAAAYQRKMKHLRLFLDNGADVHFRDTNFGATVTDFAVGGGSVEILQAVLDAGADPAGGVGSRPILIDAIESRSIEMFRFVHERFPDISVVDSVGQGCLMNACLVGSLPIVQELVELGADINQTEPMGGLPISAAAFRGHWDVVNYLISEGADPSAKYRGNRTLLFEMARSLDWPRDLAQELVENGLDIDSQEDDSNSTALIQAARKGNNSFAEFLLQNGVKTTTRDKDGMTAYDYAEFTSNGELITLFARYGVTGDDQEEQ